MYAPHLLHARASSRNHQTTTFSATTAHPAPRPDFLRFWMKSHTKPNCFLVKILNLGICGEFRISPCSYPFFTFSSPKIVNHKSLDINSPLLVIVWGDFFYIAKNTKKCLSNSV
ncbi:hypothetical protein AABB24_011009 [Solanum stoloniferum]|uniref:Uncharacterized protein n=1 Tax=Solanum stoloniferum TaxID=62892 RepID=A0ABD2UBF5_9SOLN